jgi:hypothetical protein
MLLEESKLELVLQWLFWSKIIPLDSGLDTGSAIKYATDEEENSACCYTVILSIFL